MADKYIELSATGNLQEKSAVDTGGTANANRIVALDSTGKIATSMLPTMEAENVTATATEELAAGDFVYVDSSGIHKAIATSITTIADGYVLEAYAANATATVHCEGLNDVLSGLGVGNIMFLSDTTAGAITSTAPTTSGHIVQKVGVALSTTAVSFERGEAIIRA